MAFWSHTKRKLPNALVAELKAANNGQPPIDDQALAFFDAPLDNIPLIENKFCRFATSSNVVVVLNRAAEIVYLNPIGCSMLEVEKADSYGLCWLTNFIVPEQRAELILAFESLILGDEINFASYQNDTLTYQDKVLPFRWHNRLVKTSHQQVVGTFSLGRSINDDVSSVDQIVDLSFLTKFEQY